MRLDGSTPAIGMSYSPIACSEWGPPSPPFTARSCCTPTSSPRAAFGSNLKPSGQIMTINPQMVPKAWTAPVPADLYTLSRLHLLFECNARDFQSSSDKGIGERGSSAHHLQGDDLLPRRCHGFTSPLGREHTFHAQLKMKAIGLASLKRTIVRKLSRVHWL